jgi:hypothetical protein
MQQNLLIYLGENNELRLLSRLVIKPMTACGARAITIFCVIALMCACYFARGGFGNFLFIA